jgi:hypothetical protein
MENLKAELVAFEQYEKNKVPPLCQRWKRSLAKRSLWATSKRNRYRTIYKKFLQVHNLQIDHPLMGQNKPHGTLTQNKKKLPPIVQTTLPTSHYMLPIQQNKKSATKVILNGNFSF